MTNPRVQQLHQSAASAGQVPMWDGALWSPAHAAAGVDTIPGFDDYYDLTTGAYDHEFDRADTTTLPTGWSWVNQGDSDYREVAGKGLLYAATSGGSTATNDCHRMLVRAVPSESSWVAVLKTPAMNGFWADTCRVGLVLRDSGSGKYLFAGRSVTGSDEKRCALNTWSALNTLDTAVSSGAILGIPAYIRIWKHSSTDYDLHVSSDGQGWANLWTGYDPTGLVGSFDELGVLVSTPSSGGGVSASLDWFRVRT